MKRGKALIVPNAGLDHGFFFEIRNLDPSPFIITGDVEYLEVGKQGQEIDCYSCQAELSRGHECIRAEWPSTCRQGLASLGKQIRQPT